MRHSIGSPRLSLEGSSIIQKPSCAGTTDNEPPTPAAPVRFFSTETEASEWLSGHWNDMFRTRVSCRGLTQDVGERAPAGILEEFTYRSWHKNVRSEWDGSALWLEAENDHDANGMALLREFWDILIACIKARGTISLAVESVVVVPPY